MAKKRARIAQVDRKEAARYLGSLGGEARARALKDDPKRRQEIARKGGLAAAQNRAARLTNVTAGRKA